MSQFIRQSFATQAEACDALGSPFTASMCRRLGAHLDRETAVGRLCLDWQGDPGPSADSIPLRLCGGFHALVLLGHDDKLAALYPPRAEIAPSGDVIRRVLTEHEAFLLDWMKLPPQTNEVSRSAVLWSALMALSSKVNMPLALYEVGASGGLNLRLDHFGYALGDVVCGDRNSNLQLRPEWKGDQPVQSDVQIVSRQGCDLSPLDPTDDWDALRLRAYVWPDHCRCFDLCVAVYGVCDLVRGWLSRSRLAALDRVGGVRGHCDQLRVELDHTKRG